MAREIYEITSHGKFSSDWWLKDQIQRAVVSISSNIVEGFEKNNNNEFIRFLKIAKGSAGETRNQLFIALTVGHINKDKFEYLNNETEQLSARIGSLINYLEKTRQKGEFTNKS